MKLSSLPIDVQKLAQGAMIAGEGKPYYDYEEGIKKDTGGYAYDCLMPMAEYNKVMVKVPGKQEADIKYQGKPIPVTFEGLRGNAYQNYRKGGEIEISLMAEKINMSDNRNLRINKGE